MKISDRSASIIQDIGAVLCIGGGALGVWAIDRFDQMPNYLRLAALLPFAFGIPMFGVEDYRSDWASLKGRQLGRAIAWLFIPFMLLAGVLIWFLVDPSAKA